MVDRRSPALRAPHADPYAGGRDQRFTIAVIPDTQNYLDHTHQRAGGFPFDAHAMLDRQLAWVATEARSNGGPIAFVSAVGDVWQHPSLAIDPLSLARGHRAVANPWLEGATTPSARTVSVELPAARDAYAQLHGVVPFSVVPGNHDYDATFSDARWRPAAEACEIDPGDPHSIGMLHFGGLDSFRDVFGAWSPFFHTMPWYVSSFRGGANSAQVFSAGGYTFLHIALEMDPPGDALAWAADVMDILRGLPTIISTHDYLDTAAQRKPCPIIHPSLTDPVHNDAQTVWDDFISLRDQVFLVLCGHQHGEATRVDDNVHGHPVVQLLADYQDRAQSWLERGLGGRVALGDGWLRLLEFDMSDPTPSVHVRTYSTHYDAYSTELPGYAPWYKPAEAPRLTDEQYLAKGDFVVHLDGFRERFRRAAEDHVLLAPLAR